MPAERPVGLTLALELVADNQGASCGTATMVNTVESILKVFGSGKGVPICHANESAVGSTDTCVGTLNDEGVRGWGGDRGETFNA